MPLLRSISYPIAQAMLPCLILFHSEISWLEMGQRQLWIKPKAERT